MWDSVDRGGALNLFPSLSPTETNLSILTMATPQGEDDSGDVYDRAVSSGDDGNDNERRVTTTRSYFPSPTDLYQSVFVYILFLLLGLPNEEWSSTRKEDEGFKSEDLSIIAQELDSVKQSHTQVRTKARSVRERLEQIHQRRLIRESDNTSTGQNSILSIAQQQLQGDQRVVEMARARLQRDAKKRLSGNEVRFGK
jgi:hypothetical protein